MKSKFSTALKFFLFFLITLFFLPACNFTHNQKIKKITKMERRIDNMPKNDTATASKLVIAYQEFSERYTKDSLAPEYLFRAAGICLNTGKTRQALDFYRSVPVRFPGSKWTPYSIFMQAFVVENYIGDLVEAKILYEQFIGGYPNHPLHGDAVVALEYLGRTTAQLLDELERAKPGDSIPIKYDQYRNGKKLAKPSKILPK
jgi:hypothetical protein